MNDTGEDKLSADIRRLMGRSTNAPAPKPEEQPLLLTDPVEQAQADAPAPEGPRQSPRSLDQSIRGALAKLAERDNVRPAESEDSISVSTRSLDDLEREAWRPVLAEWLDRNLERIVREQVDEALRAESNTD
jgi:cell pole-organizing protein PopZ